MCVSKLRRRESLLGLDHKGNGREATVVGHPIPSPIPRGTLTAHQLVGFNIFPTIMEVDSGVPGK